MTKVYTEQSKMIFIYLFVYLVIHYLFIYLFISNDWAQYERITTFALWFTVATVSFTIFAHSCSPTTAMRLERNALFWSINIILIIGLPPSYISLHRKVHHSSRDIVWLRTCSLNTDNMSGEYCKRKFQATTLSDNTSRLTHEKDLFWVIMP